MDERGQASTEYLILTGLSVILALIAALAVISTFQYTDQVINALVSMREQVLGALLG